MTSTYEVLLVLLIFPALCTEPSYSRCLVEDGFITVPRRATFALENDYLGFRAQILLHSSK